ncbi:CDP-glucose 4,6-dehydratase [Rhodophyticola sp.]|jgi:CDP-glucose 4,6-dehydratase|uniref:CDP-glucose 4,6-dehydratase n=1 Tax=Rhodophyticola sp. TaxID=2680032 RepID=UPI003D2A37C8
MFDWAKKRVLLTGHTGFKGAWLSEILLQRGARVFGLALAPDTIPSLFEQLGLSKRLDHCVGDIRDPEFVRKRVAQAAPDIVFHLAAQSLVRRSYAQPQETWSVNVMGTANLLDALRPVRHRCACVIVTTDKIYENREWEHPYRETDRLGGHDPYSASKAGAELVVSSYRSSFFSGGPVQLASARAGNVIGGGDWAKNRLLPDLARAFSAGEMLVLRNPASTRPWQHVLEPLAGYLRLAERLFNNDGYDAAYNFGPEIQDVRSVQEVIESAVRLWPGAYEYRKDLNAPHEAGRLMLGIERSRSRLGWTPRWDVERGIAETVGWYRDVAGGADPVALTRTQITTFEAGK